jgi:hypothetical protein
MCQPKSFFRARVHMYTRKMAWHRRWRKCASCKVARVARTRLSVLFPPIPSSSASSSLSPSLSLSLLFSLSLPFPRVPHPFSSLSVPCVLPPHGLGSRHARKLAWSAWLGLLQASKSAQSPFKMHHACLWRQLEQTVWGDNCSKQSGGKGMPSLS